MTPELALPEQAEALREREDPRAKFRELQQALPGDPREEFRQRQAELPAGPTLAADEFAPGDRARLHELATKSRTGEISESERVELTELDERQRANLVAVQRAGFSGQPPLISIPPTDPTKTRVQRAIAADLRVGEAAVGGFERGFGEERIFPRLTLQLGMPEFLVPLASMLDIPGTAVDASLRAFSGTISAAMDAIDQTLAELGVDDKTRAGIMALGEFNVNLALLVVPVAPKQSALAAISTARAAAGQKVVARLSEVPAARAARLKTDAAFVSEAKAQAATQATKIAETEAAAAAELEVGLLVKEAAVTPTAAAAVVLKAKRTAEARIAAVEARVQAAVDKFEDAVIRASGDAIDTAPEALLEEGFVDVTLTAKAQARAVMVAKEALRKQDLKPARLPGRVQEQIVEVIRTNPQALAVMTKEALAAGFGTVEEFFIAFLGTGSKAGTSLNIRRRFLDALRGAAIRGDELAAKTLDELTKKAQLRRAGVLPGEALTIADKVASVFRRSLVFHIATQVRNAVEALGTRMVLSVMARSVENTIQRVFYPGVVREPIGALDELAIIFRRRKRTFEELNRVLKAFPEERTRLLIALEPDLLRVAGRAESAFTEKTMALLRANERFQRSVIAAASLDRKLRSIGTSLTEFTAKGSPVPIPPNFTKMLAEAVDESLFRTVALNPQASKSAFERFFVGYADVIESIRIGPVPLGVLLDPFVRVFFNITKFALEITPTAGLRLMRPSVRAKIAAGDVRPLANEILGTTLFTFAVLARKGYLAPFIVPGPRFDELIVGDTLISVIPLPSLAIPLLEADLAIRLNEGRLTEDQITLRELRRAMSGGTPAFEFTASVIQDAAIAMFELSETVGFEKLGDFIGERLVGFLRPLDNIRIFVEEIDDAYSIYRETRGRGIWGALENFFTPERLPEVESPTRAGPPRRPEIELAFGLGKVGAGVMGATTGFAFRQFPNEIEAERTRLGFTPQSAQPQTGIPELDTLIKSIQGPMQEVLGREVVTAPWYLDLTVTQQKAIVNNINRVTRARARELARQEAPALFEFERIKKLPKFDLAAAMEEFNLALQSSGAGFTAEDLLDELHEAGRREVQQILGP